MWTPEIICVTNRKLCKESLTVRVEKLAAARPSAIILREKDMRPRSYGRLAEEVLEVCRKQEVRCILHTFYKQAEKLGCREIHLPLSELEQMSDKEKAGFDVIGASCHSVDDAVRAARLGCTYVTAGHVFRTRSKSGQHGRGIEFLKSVCDAVDLPVYAIGGIHTSNIHLLQDTGAAGVCVMSSAMTCEDPEEWMEGLRWHANED